MKLKLKILNLSEPLEADPIRELIAEGETWKPHRRIHDKQSATAEHVDRSTVEGTTEIPISETFREEQQEPQKQAEVTLKEESLTRALHQILIHPLET